MTEFGLVAEDGPGVAPGITVARVFTRPVSTGDDLVGKVRAACAPALAAGLAPVVSIKTPPMQTLAGRWDGQLADIGWFLWGRRGRLVYWHEPEDDMPNALTWAAAFGHVRRTLIGAVPGGVPVGHVAMAYQWEPGHRSTEDGDAWWVDADFYGVDVYSGGSAPVGPYWEHPGWRRWWDYIGLQAVGAGRPWWLTERGFRGVDDADSAVVVDEEAEALRDENGHPAAGYVLWASAGGEDDVGLVPGPLTLGAFRRMTGAA